MRDFLQAASNTAADTVAAPVDLIAFLLRKAGVPVPQNAVGGTQWMTERGLRRDVQQSPASLAGETVGLLSPVVAAAKAPQIAKGLLQVEANAAAPRTLRPEAGAIVWHGSPHKFDRFDSSKIGTGEGAQAYGHGLYLAESPDVARNYREALSKTPVTSYVAGGSEIVPGSSRWHAADIADRMRSYAIDPKTKDGKEWLSSELGARYMGGAEVSKAEVLKYLKIGAEKKQELGSLYKVDLPDEKIARMLDWDKPLSQQPEAVRKTLLENEAVQQYMAKANAERNALNQAHPARLSHPVLGKIASKAVDESSVKAQTAYEKLTQQFGPQQAAKMLREAGIPGIRYLDGGSRGAGAGTSNFVVFPGEEQFLRILERNGGLLGP